MKNKIAISFMFFLIGSWQVSYAMLGRVAGSPHYSKYKVDSNAPKVPTVAKREKLPKVNIDWEPYEDLVNNEPQASKSLTTDQSVAQTPEKTTFDLLGLDKLSLKPLGLKAILPNNQKLPNSNFSQVALPRRSQTRSQSETFVANQPGESVQSQQGISAMPSRKGVRPVRREAVVEAASEVVAANQPGESVASSIDMVSVPRNSRGGKAQEVVVDSVESVDQIKAREQLQTYEAEIAQLKAQLAKAQGQISQVKPEVVAVDTASHFEYKDQVQSKFPSLPEVDVVKIAQLVQIIKDSNFASVLEMMAPGKADRYQKLKKTLYPEGFPEGVISSDLLQLSGAQGPAVSPNQFLQSIQKGTQLTKAVQSDKNVVETSKKQDSAALIEELKKSSARGLKSTSNNDSVINSPDQARIKAMNDKKAEIKAQVEEAFTQKESEIRLGLEQKYAQFKKDPNFKDMMDKHLAAKKEGEIDLAYEQNKDQILLAGEIATKKFNEQNIKLVSSSEGIKSSQRTSVQPVDPIQLVRDAAMKQKWRKIIYDQVMLQEPAIRLDKEFNNPGAIEATLKPLVQSALKDLESRVRRDSNNLTAVQQAGDQAVAQWQAAQQQSPAQSVVSMQKTPRSRSDSPAGVENLPSNNGSPESSRATSPVTA